jgi:hypothetical protein
VIYTAHDPNSRYIEHEYCHFFVATIDELPSFEPDIAYGFTLQTAKDLKDPKNPLHPALAAWVRAFISEGLI